MIQDISHHPAHFHIKTNLELLNQEDLNYSDPIISSGPQTQFIKFLMEIVNILSQEHTDASEFTVDSTYPASALEVNYEYLK
jgi:hypothetical protein